MAMELATPAPAPIPADRNIVLAPTATATVETHKKNRIQVSNTKKPLFLYVNLAKRYIQQHNELEHLLDDNEDMADLYLTRKWIQNQDLEMLLEAYFMQLEGMRNKILTVREYIDDTEDYVNVQLDNQRNHLIPATDDADHSLVCNKCRDIVGQLVRDEHTMSIV